ncbi:uncharacterized protein LOC128545877 [Mercenaria mercenaria]|uniref:uncharacterized protein LOC128545877 n=1 Tax=Mercenaria mercenaria TaxID=6596 RepID=UPI00234F8912|nr:uncharacterized protein LOC128545877 [Mercenaria mercenaria]
MPFKEMHWPVSVGMVVVFMLTGWILNFVSFTAPFWNNSKLYHWGLWQMCDERTGCDGISSKDLTDVMQIGRIFLTLSFIAYFVLIILVVLYLFWRSDLRFLSAAAVTSFLILLGLFLGAILWISRANTTLSWCYYLCYASAFLVSASGGVILHVRRQERLRLNDVQEQPQEIRLAGV